MIVIVTVIGSFPLLIIFTLLGAVLFRILYVLVDLLRADDARRVRDGRRRGGGGRGGGGHHSLRLLDEPVGVLALQRRWRGGRRRGGHSSRTLVERHTLVARATHGGSVDTIMSLKYLVTFIIFIIINYQIKYHLL